MLSGNYGCHPDYARNLVERKEYNIEDIWNILEAITVNEPVGYKKELVDAVLRKGIFDKEIISAGTRQDSSGSERMANKVTYVNRHKGRDFLVLANGDTLKQCQSEINALIDKYAPIVMGGNFLGGLFKPHYHAFINKKRFVDYIDSVAANSKILVGQHLPQAMIKEYYAGEYETIYYQDSLENPFDIKAGVITANCRTVAVLLAGVALVMGAKRLFIVGMDGYMATSAEGLYHFYQEKNEAEQLDDLKEKHKWNLFYLKQINAFMMSHGGEGLHILTPTNYKEFYKGIKNYI